MGFNFKFCIICFTVFYVWFRIYGWRKWWEPWKVYICWFFGIPHYIRFVLAWVYVFVDKINMMIIKLCCVLFYSKYTLLNTNVDSFGGLSSLEKISKKWCPTSPIVPRSTKANHMVYKLWNWCWIFWWYRKNSSSCRKHYFYLISL